MPVSVATAGPELLQLGWLALLGHALHHGGVVAGLVGVTLLLAPGVVHGRRRASDGRGHRAAPGETPR